MDRVYLNSSDVIAVFDHEKKRTFTVQMEGLSDVGKGISHRIDILI